jgi:hypothetical protein
MLRMLRIGCKKALIKAYENVNPKQLARMKQ